MTAAGQRLRSLAREHFLLVVALLLATSSVAAFVLWASAPEGETVSPAATAVAPPPVAAAAPTSAPTAVVSRTLEPTAGSGPVAEAEPTAGTYRVAPGDTLAAIAARHGLRLETLLWANDLSDPDLLRPEQELHIPAADGALYTVRPGDTLRDLAQSVGVPLAELIAVNDLPDPDRVTPGTRILVPGVSPDDLPGQG